MGEDEGRILALDLGEASVGVAVSDPSRTIAQPLAGLPARPWNGFIERLQELLRAHTPSLVVVGIAVREDGSMGPEAQAQRRLGRRLEQCLGVPVVEHDERYTTKMARRVQRELGVHGRRARKNIHSLAAAHLLSDFLQHEQRKSQRAGERRSRGAEEQGNGRAGGRGAKR